MSTPRVLPYIALVGTSLLFACPPEETNTRLAQPRTVSASQLLQDANANLRTHLMGSESAMQAIDVEALFGQITPDAPPCPGEGPCDDPEPIEISIDGAQIADMMAQEVLNAAHTEASSPTSLTLRFDEAMCPPEGEAGTRDPDCMQAAAQMQPRLHLTSLSAGDVSASLQMGAARAEIARLELHQAHLAVEIDLGAAKVGLETLASTLPDVPEDMLSALRGATVQGRLRAEVGPNAASLYAARLSVLSRVVVETSVEGEAIALHVEPAQPALQVTVDPSTQTVTAELSSGGMDLTAPFNLFNADIGAAPCTVGPDGETNCDDPVEPEPLMGSFQLIAPASTARLIMTGSDRIFLDNISAAGPLQAKLDSRTLLSATLGQGAFSLEMRELQDNLLIQVMPSASLAVEFDLATLAQQVEVPNWMLSERLALTMNGDPMPTMAIDNEDGQMRMTQGRLTIDSRAANRQIVVEAGQCLIGTETEPSSEDAHPLETVMGGACN